MTSTLFFLIRSLEPGGAERQLVALANGLTRRGHTVHIATFYSGGELEADLDGPILHTLHKSGRWDLFGFFLRLIRLIRSIRPDAVHGYLGTANILLALAKVPLGKLPVIWGVRASNMELSHYSRLHRLHWRVEVALSSIPDRIVYNAEAGRKRSERAGFPPGKGMVIPNGIDTGRFAPDKVAGKILRDKWGVAPGHRLIGLPARLDPMKDHRTFLEAAKILSKKNSDIHFVCIGDGPLKDRLQEFLAELRLGDRVRWVGHHGNMPDVYSAIDLCCLSSAFGEGFSNVLGEAMSCGTPCVATDVGDAARILGELGICVPPGNAEALAGAMTRMLKRIEEEGPALGAACRHRVEDNFGLERMVSRTEQAIEDAITRRTNAHQR